ncbi:MAG: tetratricopeptide repeat protein [Nitrospirales bacterium]
MTHVLQSAQDQSFPPPVVVRLPGGRAATGLASLLAGFCLVCLGPARAVEPAPSSVSRPAAEAAGPVALAESVKTGWWLLETGRHREAEWVFRDILSESGKQGAAWVGLGLSQHLQGRDEAALTSLQEALRLHTHVSWAHRVSGDILYRQGQLTEALGHYHAALEADPNDVIAKGRVLAVGRAHRADAGLDRLFTAHFMMKFPGEAKVALVTYIAAGLERAHQDVARVFAYQPTRSMTVHLYPARQFQEVTLSPSWVEGLYDGIIHLAIEGFQHNPRRAHALLVHEYTHAVVHEISGGYAPAWLQEGLARLLERQLGDPRAADVMRPDRPGYTISPPVPLTQSFTGMTRQDAAAAYGYSEVLVRSLIERYGFDGVRMLLRALAGTRDVGVAFEQTFGMTVEEFQAEVAVRPAERN